MTVCVEQVATEVPKGHSRGDIWEPLRRADLDSGERGSGVINPEMGWDAVTERRCGERERRKMEEKRWVGTGSL